uniref:Uncharacterized protein n=1 Tax=Sphaerodactylus townsendi TaxID=933632 RepID=A0ACB8E8X2_9SAUR
MGIEELRRQRGFWWQKPLAAAVTTGQCGSGRDGDGRWSRQRPLLRRALQNLSPRLRRRGRQPTFPMLLGCLGCLPFIAASCFIYCDQRELGWRKECRWQRPPDRCLVCWAGPELPERSRRAEPAMVIASGIAIPEPEAAKTTSAQTGPDGGGGASQDAPVTPQEATLMILLSAQLLDTGTSQETILHLLTQLKPVPQYITCLVEVQQWDYHLSGNQLLVDVKLLVGNSVAEIRVGGSDSSTAALCTYPCLHFLDPIDHT